MAISAYKAGQLKKNPLLGSSLKTDPGRQEERRKFMSLYGEAKQYAGQGREGAVRRLSERYQKFGAPHAKRMTGLSEQLGALKFTDNTEERIAARGTWEEAKSQEDRLESAKHYSQLSPEMQSKLEKMRVAQVGEKGKQWQWRRKLAHAKKQYPRTAATAKKTYDTLVAENTKRLAEYKSVSGSLTDQYNRARGTLQARADEYNRFLGSA